MKKITKKELQLIVDNATEAGLDSKAITKKLKGYLLFEYQLEGKEANEVLRSHGFASTTAVGFAASFYEELRKGPMTDERFAEVIAAGSKNVQNHRAHYNGIRQLTNDVHKSK